MWCVVRAVANMGAPGGVGFGIGAGAGMMGVGAAGVATPIDLAAMQAQIAAQLEQVQQAAGGQPKAPPLLLDDKGRQVDKHGNVIAPDGSLISDRDGVAADVAANPYLAHLKSSDAGAAAGAGASAAVGAGAGADADGNEGRGRGRGRDGDEKRPPPVVTAPPGALPMGATAKSRDARIAKAFRFVEKGSVVARAENLRERKARAAAVSAHIGLGSRMRPETHGDVPQDADAGAGVGAAGTTAGTTAGGFGAAGGVGTSASDAAGVATVDGALLHVPRRMWDTPTPDVEWWDAAFLPSDRRKARGAAETQAARRGGVNAAMKHILETDGLRASYDDLACKNQKSHQLVEHPVPVQPVVDKDAPVAMPMMLTVKEKKRLRRARRKEKIDDLREKQAAGLIPAPEPKVKLSNLMRVLGTQAVLDPTEMEARVRAQAAERRRDHEMRNAARQLTPAERRAKEKAKLLKGVEDGVHVALFRVRRLTNKQQRYKVDINARELHMTGCVVLCRSAPVNLVLVEGSQKAVKKYKRLMEHRIDWNSIPADEDDGAAAAAAAAGVDDTNDVDGDDGPPPFVDDQPNRCATVWGGIVDRRSFSSFSFQECVSVEAARRWMHSKGLAHYWDLVWASHCTEHADDAIVADGVDVKGLLLAAMSGGGGAGGAGVDTNMDE